MPELSSAMPLDEKALAAARLLPIGSERHEVIRAYLSSLTPSPVGDLVDATMERIVQECETEKWFLGTVNARAVIRKHIAASLTSLSAEVARERVENERLRKFVETARDYAREIGDDAMYEDADAALSAPKGGEHGE